MGDGDGGDGMRVRACVGVFVCMCSMCTSMGTSRQVCSMCSSMHVHTCMYAQLLMLHVHVDAVSMCMRVLMLVDEAWAMATAVTA